MNTENKKQQSNRETGAAQKEKVQFPKKKLGGILYFAVVLLSGIFAGALAAGINGMVLGWYAWPLVICVDLFVFSTTGFFLTEGKEEVLYGTCSIISVGCAIVQLAITF